MGRRCLTATSASSRQSNANANSPGDGLHRESAARKSAWVRHLAGRMGIQVLQKRASDLLLGGSERNIANACPRFYTQKPLPTRVGVYEKMIKFIETVGEVR